MEYKGFTIDDDYYKAQLAHNLAPAVCNGCGDFLSFVRDIRKPHYCPSCSPKASLLKRYSRDGYTPNAEQRAAIFKTSTIRGGKA